ncbi:MAG: hypothetical protein QXK74_01810 [Candidatus Nitrosocaldaceae archaeon]
MSRIDEWFVPKIGPLRFRIFIGMLFLPYTGICISFTIIGSLLTENVYWDRLYAITIIYFSGLGVSAHLFDAIGSKIKPWGNYFNEKYLLLIALISLILAYVIGIYYIITYSLYILAIIAILEGFFLFAYNLELFNSRFHNNISFAFSWGSLPLLAGYFIQTNQITLLPMLVSLLTGALSYLEIKISKRYKEIKRNKSTDFKSYESILKILTITIISTSFLLLINKMLND